MAGLVFVSPDPYEVAGALEVLDVEREAAA